MLLNFAHGDIIMVGGYIALISILNRFGPFISVFFAISGCAVISVLIERLAYRPLRKASKTSLLITAIGVSIFLQNLAQLIFSANGRPFPASSILKNNKMRFGKINVNSVTIITILISIISMLLLVILVHKTKLGKAMRAVSEDLESGQLMGINIDKVISFTFILGSSLAGIASIMFCCQYPLVNPTMGYMIGMKAFIAAVLGGIGSIPGAVVGGFTIGFVEIFVSAIGFSAWIDVAVFAVLIIVLLIRPFGILGRRLTEKV
jgi:branched-chain amino acid transport system permease protein